MTLWITACSGYIILILMAVYTIAAFSAMWARRREAGFVLCMEICRFLLHGTGYLALFLQTRDWRLVPFYLFQTAFFLLSGILQRRCYKNSSRLLFENMLLLLSVGFVMLTRLSFDKAARQFVFAVAAMGVCLCLPFLLEKFKFLSKLGWLYAAGGLALLLLVLLNGISIFGAKNWLSIKGIVFQPSEFVKLLYLLALSALLSEWKFRTKRKENQGRQDFLHLLIISIVAALHVSLLAISNDFGGALIFFVLYLVMIFVISGNKLFPTVAGVMAVFAVQLVYQYSGHVKDRVLAWSNPFSCIDKEGYQIAHSLFAIGSGGWFGTGLKKGMPEKIPVVTSDFIFSAISEEFGAVFAALLLCIYINCIIWMLRLALEQKEKFAFSVTAGAAALFGFQTFLNVGGVIKMIPSTGVTLPLISYGGSSLISMLLLLQGTQAMQGVQEEAAENETEEGKTKKKPVVWKREDKERCKKRMTGVCAGLILTLCITVAYFLGVTVENAEEVFFNDYNPRVKALEQKMLRGKILTLDGEILAQSVPGEDGIIYRVYPYGEAAVFLTGRVKNGETGLEKTEKETLLTAELPFWKRFLKEATGELLEGNRIVTTIDSKLQKTAYQVLEGQKGAVCVLEVQTGRLLAMASSPAYNPNEISEMWDNLLLSEDAPFLNRVLGGLYPPGSVFKIVTTLAFLKEHTAEEFSYTCTGSITVGNVTMHCYDGKAHGTQSLKKAFANSCNSAYAYMSSLISPEVFLKTATELGFGTVFEGTLPYSAGSFSYESSMENALIAQTAFGQGKTLVSPFQNLLLTAAVAGGGTLVLPYEIEQVVSMDDVILKTGASPGTLQLMSREEARFLTECMTEASEKYMTEWKAEGITVAGKTGSAEISKESPAHAWYVCFAPAEAPEIAICVLIEQAGTGGRYAVPAAKELLSVYFHKSDVSE
ncbi:MAG: FtsW/RodA/SpoVE family cell cycle protein [Lachnospiraceae bacterium]